jgi:hypothetical protein
VEKEDEIENPKEEADYENSSFVNAYDFFSRVKRKGRTGSGWSQRFSIEFQGVHYDRGKYHRFAKPASTGRQDNHF